MRILWLCNTVPSDFCDALGFRKRQYEGWISGMLHKIRQCDHVELGVCIPIHNPERMMDGEMGNCQFYSFLSVNPSSISEGLIDRLQQICYEFKPDVVHIWGTEYGQSLAMILACERAGMRSRTVVHIQGLISAIIPYYAMGIPSEWLSFRGDKNDSMCDEINSFRNRGENEKKILREASYALGRTFWDESYLKSISNIQYRYCGEILRKEFYVSKKKWCVDQCERHTIFITQGQYAYKGIHLILPAIRTLKKLYPDFKLLISGKNALVPSFVGELTPYAEYVKLLMDEYDIYDCIEFLGELSPEQMIETYLRSNLLAVSSTIENSSNSIGEAQLLGVPVVASYTGGTPSLVDQGRTGLMYQMDADYMFAACVRQIFDDDAFAELLAENERRVAHNRYDPEVVLDQLLKVYKEVINKDGKLL